jgi:hypothetical protein
VYVGKKSNKWEAQIKHNKKTIYLGCIKNIEDAKRVRKEKALQLYGEYTNSCEL